MCRDKIVDSEALLQESTRKHRLSLKSTIPTCLFHGLIAPKLTGFIRCRFLELEHRHDKSVTVRLLNCTFRNETIKCNGRDF